MRDRQIHIREDREDYSLVGHPAGTNKRRREEGGGAGRGGAHFLDSTLRNCVLCTATVGGPFGHMKPLWRVHQRVWTAKARVTHLTSAMSRAVCLRSFVTVLLHKMHRLFQVFSFGR
jgi:hypothetical protein